MHANWAEVAPAAGAASELLGPLLVLCGLVFALGCVVLIDGFVRALFGAVASIFSGIPGVGGLTDRAIHSAEHAISNALGTAIQGIEARIAHQWHNLARAAQRLWNYQVTVAENLWHLTQWVAGGGISRGLEHLVARAIHRVESLTKTVTHDLTRVVHRTTVKVESIAQGVYPRLRTLEHEVTRTLPREIRHARSLAREAENGVARLWARVRALERTAGAEAIALAVATALAAIGLDWLACRDGASRAGRSGCNLWDDLGGIFGLLALEIAAMDFDTLVHTAQDLTEEGVSAFDSVFGLSR